jgi:hypothetical protein
MIEWMVPVALVLVAVLAPFFGADSRRSGEWLPSAPLHQPADRSDVLRP